MSHLFLFLLFGASFLSSSEGKCDNNSTVKHRNARFSSLIIYKPKKIHNLSYLKPPAIQICQSKCQKDWISYKGHCYMLIEKRMTWTQAERACWARREGSHLTSITSAAENVFLHQLAQRVKETRFWTGGTYQKASGSSLKWADGSLTVFIQNPVSSLLRTFKGLFHRVLNIKFCLTLNTGG
ncbi:SLBA protein, partial [Nothoprocta ornata]|nr:SLBA protein [Nothoprocta pentlandii]NWY02673.1 SLBA protein [Nothoprocta ornata]